MEWIEDGEEERVERRYYTYLVLHLHRSQGRPNRRVVVHLSSEKK